MSIKQSVTTLIVAGLMLALPQFAMAGCMGGRGIDPTIHDSTRTLGEGSQWCDDNGTLCATVYTVTRTNSTQTSFYCKTSDNTCYKTLGGCESNCGDVKNTLKGTLNNANGDATKIKTTSVLHSCVITTNATPSGN